MKTAITRYKRFFIFLKRLLVLYYKIGEKLDKYNKYIYNLVMNKNSGRKIKVAAANGYKT
jgi:hypothetical protein